MFHSCILHFNNQKLDLLFLYVWVLWNNYFFFTKWKLKKRYIGARWHSRNPDPTMFKQLKIINFFDKTPIPTLPVVIGDKTPPRPPPRPRFPQYKSIGIQKTHPTLVPQRAPCNFHYFCAHFPSQRRYTYRLWMFCSMNNIATEIIISHTGLFIRCCHTLMQWIENHSSILNSK